MTTVAIIPARGGSKRLPGKNIKPLAGKPLIAWTIEAALNANCFDKVVVSTDSTEIAEVAKIYGADIPCLRPKELAKDNTETGPVIEHMTLEIEYQTSLSISDICILQPTSPLRTDVNIVEALAKYYDKQADFLTSLSEVNVKQELCNQLSSDHSLKGFLSKSLRTQKMKPIYRVNGAIYFIKRNKLKDLNKIYERADAPYAYIMPEINSVDIDTEIDFLWAEFLINKKFKNL